MEIPPIPPIHVVEDEDRDYRYSICKVCENIRKDKTCGICNCITPIMTVWPYSECPIGKWPRIYIKTDL